MSVFRQQCTQFTVWLICGSGAHVHHSAHHVNLFPDAYVVSCNVWDSYLSSCLKCVEKVNWETFTPYDRHKGYFCTHNPVCFFTTRNFIQSQIHFCRERNCNQIMFPIKTRIWRQWMLLVSCIYVVNGFHSTSLAVQCPVLWLQCC